MVGANLQRLELVAERGDYRRPLHSLLALLSKCPALEYLSLGTCISTGHLLDVPRNDLPPFVTLELPQLQFFALTDNTRILLSFVPFVHIPQTIDLHLVFIEDFGRQRYSIETLRRNISSAVLAFNSLSTPVIPLSALTVEVILDDGRDTATAAGAHREWPEEIRVSLHPDVSTAQRRNSAYTPYCDGILHREHTVTPDAPHHSLAIRSRMLSTKPTAVEYRRRPAWTVDNGSYPADDTIIIVPRLNEIVTCFMQGIQLLGAMRSVQTIILPRHAFIPTDVTGWASLLSSVDMTTLISGAQSQEQVESLWGYLASRRGGLWPHNMLRSVQLPHYSFGDGGGSRENRERFRKFTEFHCDLRRGCADITWDVFPESV